MKRFIAVLLAVAMLTTLSISHDSVAETDTEVFSFSDPALLPYIEDEIYAELITALDGTDYVVENVEAVYVSQEYLEEVAYNTRANIYFGYTMAELDAQFEGTRYVFTLGEDDQTTVIPFQEYIEEDIYTKILKNVAIGAGVIIVCVTIASITSVSAPAISMILTFGAKEGAEFAAKSAGFGFVSSGVFGYIKKGNIEDAFNEALVGASEGFMWGAIAGSVSGAISESSFLYTWHKATDISWKEAAIIQRESNYSLDFIRTVHSMDEYEIYKKAGLKEYRLGDKRLLLPESVDLNIVDAEGKTNLQRMLKGMNPIDCDGRSYEWHHVGQKKDAPLALLTYEQHRSNYKILTYQQGSSEIDRKEFEQIKKIINNAAGRFYEKL
ncbi:MAG: hypothetical protein IKR85_05455 [Clostridia bacterium]|nr:hypothetical protein [Clostridia bacterium]